MLWIALIVALTPQITQSVMSTTYDGWIFYTTEQLYDTCSSQNLADKAKCSAYICGISDAWSTQYILTRQKTYKICLPTTQVGLDCASMANRVFQYLDAHPEARHGAAAGSVSYALQEIFPCEK